MAEFSAHGYVNGGFTGMMQTEGFRDEVLATLRENLDFPFEQWLPDGARIAVRATFGKNGRAFGKRLSTRRVYGKECRTADGARATIKAILDAEFTRPRSRPAPGERLPRENSGRLREKRLTFRGGPLSGHNP